MRSILFMSLYLLSLNYLDAQTDNQVVMGKIDSVYSTILGEQRKIWVYNPSGAPADIFTQTRYPVVYLLDGDAHFYSVAGMIHQLSSINGNTICPEMIVVGIPNTDRTRDLTPTHVDADPPFLDSNFARSSGGGEKFISFLEKELIPHIDSTYPTQPYKMFIGHSFGGLLAMHTFIHHTKLFNAYVAIDPSMWWHHEKLLNECKTALASRKFAGTSLYLGIANTLSDGMSIEKAVKDTASDTRHIRSILKLDQYLKSNRQNGLRYSGKYYKEDDHGSVPLISEYDALRFIFSYYRMKITTKDFLDSTVSLADRMVRQYDTISKYFGYTVKPPESYVNPLAYQFLRMNHYKKAEALFRLNIANYPESFNVYDSYGDFLEAKGNKPAAIEQYKKSLSLKETAGTRQKLDALTGIYNSDNSAPHLMQYAGEFDLMGMTLKMFVQKSKLLCFAPGQPLYELEPGKEPNEFTIKDVPGYSIRYKMDAGKPVAVTVIQPNGTYEAKPKKN